MVDPASSHGDRGPPASDHWVRVRAALERVVDLPAEQRAGALRSACGGDAELEREVRRLLEAEPGLGSFLEPPAEDSRAGLRSGELTAGQRIGAWRVEELLGRGGMGEVYLAARVDEPHQRAALKVVRSGARGADVLRRFRRERRLLARLAHPGIARLIDGGVSAEGLPFLVMEYVEGEPIERWCARRELALRDRLELFLRVCAAVQHAHRCLVVHRDLKPGNILVAADGQPKLLDFGIAKVLGAEEDTDASERTAAGQQPLTPAYASPEQLRQEPVTTATDVYSLGMILYELLCGVRPHELAGHSPAEWERQVCEREPPPPSARLDGGATTRWRRALSGDLDTIALAALRREPERRYASVADLARDVDRHLRGLPIAARPDTLRYRTTRFVARHRWMVGALAVVFLALSAGLLASQVLLARARAAHEGQERATEEAQELVAGLREQVRRAGRAREAAAAERRRADLLFQDLLASSVANVFDFGRELRGLSGGQVLRLDMIAGAVGMLEELSRTAPADPDIRHQLLRATVELGEAQGEVAAEDEDEALAGRALASFRRAVELGEELAAQDPSRAREVAALLDPCRRALAGHEPD